LLFDRSIVIILKGEITMKRQNVVTAVLLATGLTVAGCAHQPSARDSEPILTIDHYVSMRSSIPDLSGQNTRIYVRERAKAGTIARDAAAANRVVLFIHGAGTPAEVAFDVPHQDYSWMAYLARAGFDVYSMEHTGYGRSMRPEVMDDPCNLSPKQQAAIVRSAAGCKPNPPRNLSPITAEWEEIGAVVDYLRALRGVQTVSLVAWSRGGPRAAGYAALRPDKVDRMVLLAPGYARAMPATAPTKLPADAAVVNTQSREEFIANWDRQVGCPNQYDAATLDSVWSEMLRSDPLGATWGSGVRRAPGTTVWGWTQAVVAKTQIPTLMVTGEHDKQVAPERVQHLYDDLGSSRKVFVQLACSSHNAMWEMNRMLLFRASLEWLTKGSVNGTQAGMLRLGY
jgi:pimeloyl-ACP methyl ester carboxylesterase